MPDTDSAVPQGYDPGAWPTGSSSSSSSGSSSVNDSLGIDDNKLKEVTSKLADNTRAKIGAEDKLLGEVSSAQNRMIPKLEKLVDKEIAGVDSHDLKHWDEAAEKKKYSTDPVEAFGSLGSVFGVVASAFTRNPMVNALNASAAAMTAMKEHNDEQYNRAYKAWQDNTKLALERQKITHEAYQDATSLLQTNMTAADTKFRVLAARFGDQQLLTLQEAGMSKEVQDLLISRQTAAIQLAENMPKIAAAHDEYGFLVSNGYDSKNPQSPESIAAYDKLRERQLKYAQAEQDVKAPEVQRLLKDYRTTPKEDGTLPTVAERGEFYDKHVGIAGRGASSIPNKFLSDYDTAHPLDPGASTEEQAAHDVEKYKALSEFMAAQHKPAGGSGGGNKDLTTDRQQAQDVKAVVDKYQQDHPDATPEEVAKFRADTARELKTRAAAPTGNKVDEIKGKINRIEYAESTIDKVEELLKKHKAITGLGGVVTRPAEVVSNVFGGNETDRKQFERYIAELQEWAPRILTDSNGRPLSAEAGKVQTIIAGLKLGDTTANTERAYRELKPLLARIKGDLQNRQTGGAGAPAKSEPPQESDQPWLRDPVAQ